MEKQFYYRDLTFPQGDQKCEDTPLLANCCGVTPTPRAFMSHNPVGRQDYYLQYVTDGQLPSLLDGETVDFHEDMFVLYRPHTPYRYWHEADHTMCYYWIHFTGYHIPALLESFDLETNRFYRIAPSHTLKSRICSYFHQLFQEFIHRRPGFDSACAAIVTSILVELARGTDRLQTGSLRKLKTIEYLHTHYDQDIPISALAAMEHLSISRYREVFHSVTGFSPSDYRTTLRLQHACNLLTTTELSMTQIAAECGYEDVLYFFRLFKKRQGLTPSQYRSQFR